MLFDIMFFEDRYSAAIVRDDLIAATFVVREILAKGSGRTVLDREEKSVLYPTRESFQVSRLIPTIYNN
jgi:hypothetical protein